MALRMTDFGPAMFNILQLQLKFVFMVFSSAIELGSAAGQHSQNGDFLAFKNGITPAAEIKKPLLRSSLQAPVWPYAGKSKAI